MGEVGLKEYLESQVDFLKEIVRLSAEAADRAIQKNEQAAEKRFEGMNEFRQALSDQSNTFLTRTEYSLNHRNLTDKVEILNGRIAELTTIYATKSEGLSKLGAITLGTLAVIATLISAITLVFNLLHLAVK